jgi:hypothetical protein
MARWQQYVMDRLLRAALPALLQVGEGGAAGTACIVRCYCESGAGTQPLASACFVVCGV